MPSTPARRKIATLGSLAGQEGPLSGDATLAAALQQLTQVLGRAGNVPLPTGTHVDYTTDIVRQGQGQGPGPGGSGPFHGLGRVLGRMNSDVVASRYNFRPRSSLSASSSSHQSRRGSGRGRGSGSTMRQGQDEGDVGDGSRGGDGVCDDQADGEYIYGERDGDGDGEGEGDDQSVAGGHIMHTAVVVSDNIGTGE